MAVTFLDIFDTLKAISEEYLAKTRKMQDKDV